MPSRNSKKLRLLVVLDDAETGGDVRLERKQMQEPLAEGVDRLHLETARRLHRARKQAPRKSELLPIDAILANVLYRGAKLAVVHRRPTGEHFENALRHVRRRSLRVGPAKNEAPSAPFQQQ